MNDGQSTAGPVAPSAYASVRGHETPAGVELKLEDTFHRLKRTVMVLSGALFLLGCTDPEIARKVVDGLPSVDGVVRASNVVLRAGLLAALIYYVWGFWHEATAAERANRGLLDEGALASYEAQLAAFIERTKTQSDQLEAVVTSIAPRAEAFLASWRRVYEELPKGQSTALTQGAWSFDDSNAGWSWRIPKDQHAAMEEKRDAAILGVVRGFYEGQAATADRAVEALRAIHEDWTPTVALIRDMQTRAERAGEQLTLNRQIYRDRRIGFYLWEVGSTYAAASLAALVTLTPLGFKFADWLTAVVVRFSW